jgi:hypothetical protein
VNLDAARAAPREPRTCPVRRIGDTISGVEVARVSIAGALVFGLSLGCQASLSADANVNGQGASADGDAEVRGSASGDGEGKGEMTRLSGVSPNGGTETDASRVLLGARHDLRLTSGKATASCQCLAVALGDSRSAGMAWSAGAPQLDQATQLSIALSSEGQACKDEPKKSLGASYWGYRISGNDVVVLVEAARGGRPLTNGAVIPKPVGAGQVFVAPASKKLPYGRPLDGKGLCKVGNPGVQRTMPFSALEVGQNAPDHGTALTGSGERALSDQSEDTPTTIEMPSN